MDELFTYSLNYTVNVNGWYVCIQSLDTVESINTMKRKTFYNEVNHSEVDYISKRNSELKVVILALTLDQFRKVIKGFKFFKKKKIIRLITRTEYDL